MTKRLLFVVNVDWFFVSHRLPIAIEALEKGYEVHLACSFTDKADYLKSLGIHLHEITFSRSGLGMLSELRTLVSLVRLFQKLKPDILHTVTIKPVLYGGIASRLAGVPAMVSAVSGLGFVFVAETFKAKITKEIVRLLYGFAFRHQNMKVIFQNSSDRDILVGAVNLSASKVSMISGSGVDLGEYTYQPEPENCRYIVMASRLLKEKGVFQFVNAARLLKKKGFAFEFLLVGVPDSGNPNSVSIAELEEWKAEGVIQVLGFRADVKDIFVNASMVVLPSFYGEGLPKVLIEAAACGRPIITSDNPGCRDAVIDGETGIVVPIKDEVKLAEAIEYLANNKEIRLRMGQKARLLAETEFDINCVVDKHLKIYAELTGFV